MPQAEIGQIEGREVREAEPKSLGRGGEIAVILLQIPERGSVSFFLARQDIILPACVESVRQVLAGASVDSVASSLGIPKASLGNWVRQQQRGELGVAATPVKAPALAAGQRVRGCLMSGW